MITLLFSIGIFSEALPFAYSETTDNNEEVVFEFEELPGTDSEYLEIFSVGGQEIARRKMAMIFEGGVPRVDIVEIANNIPDGIVKMYFPNGKLAREINYRNNKQNGLTKMFNEDGVLMNETNISDDKVNNSKYFYNSGTLKMEIADSKITGYYEDGAVKFEMDMKNNDYKRYDEFGNVFSMESVFIEEYTEEFMNDMKAYSIFNK